LLTRTAVGSRLAPAFIGLVLLTPPLAATTAGAQPTYSIVELAGVPQRLNENGQIAGWVFVGADAHAAIYSGGAWQDLGVPAGDQLSALFSISNTGAAVGYSFASLPGPDNRWQAIWAPAGATAVQALSVIAPDSFAYGINDSAAIVGCLNRYDDIYPDPHRAFLYSGGSLTDLHELLSPSATQTPFDFTCARDVNNAGVVVGEVQLATAPQRGFVYSNGVVNRTEQGTSYLVNARAISSTGKVVGEGRRNTFTADHALVYDVANGTITSLGLELTGAFSSRPNDVNTAGDVAGMMFLSVGEHAFLATGGQVFDLNDLIPAGTEWVLQEAFSINDAGQIVGKGYLTSSPTVTRYFFLLTDTVDPEQATADLIEAVQGLRASGALRSGNANALIVKLEAAMTHLDAGNVGLAVEKLEDFINQVEAFIRTRKLDPEAGEPLIDEARAIIDTLTS
jgi:probable HAF family extracellular repeat protein